MTAANLDHTDLNAATFGGVVREDVMEKIWLIDRFPLPFTDLCAKDTSGNQYKEFTVDELGAAATDNATIDGADVTQNDTVIGNRQGNYHQTAVKGIQVSHRANAANSIGRQGSLSYQISRGQQRLRRDVEAQMLTPQASVAGDGAAVAGVSAGFQAWIKTNVSYGATGSAGGFNFSTGIVDAPTAGTARALTETLVRDIAQMVYEEGGNTYCLMGTPQVIRLLSEYLFSSSARIATQTNYNQGTNQNQGSTAYGSNNVFVTDFGQILRMKDNRLQAVTAANESALFFIDNTKIRQSFLTGYRTMPLARTGLSEKRMISVDYSLLVTNEKAHGCIADIDETAPVTDA